MRDSDLIHAAVPPESFSQEALYRLFQATPNPYLILLPDAPHFTIVDVNEQYLAVTNTCREDLIGKPVFEVFPANPDAPKETGTTDFRASLERVLRDQVQDEMGIQRYDIPRRKRGERGFEVRYWTPVNTPVFAANGTISAIIHHVKDITEHVLDQDQTAQVVSQAESECMLAHKQLKEANTHLKQIQERLTLALDGSQVGLWDWDFRSDKAWWDDRCAEIIGTHIPPDERGLKSMIPYIHPEDRNIVPDALQAHLKGEKNFEFEIRFLQPSGEVRYTFTKGTALRDEQGQVIRLTGIIMDITHHKMTVLRMERQNRQQVGLVNLGLQALSGNSGFQDILNATVKTVADTLEVGYAKILRYNPEPESFTFKAVKGFDSALVGQQLKINEESQARYTLQKDEPVVVEDIRREQRFEPSRIHKEYQLISGLSTVIHVGGRPYAILQADTKHQRRFTEDEINFLQNVANLMGLVIERRNVEEQILASTERFNRVLEGSDEGYWDWDVAQNSLYWSDRLYEMLGLSREEVGEVTYTTYESRLPEAERDRISMAIAATIQNSVPFTEVFKLRHASGEYRDYYSRAKPYFDEQGQVIRIAGMIADITERIRMDEALLDYQHRLERSNKELEQFAAIASHDLKAPLRKISTFCGVLEQTDGSKLSPEGRDYLQRINRSAEKMQRLVSDLLTLSRVTSEARPFKPINLQDVLLEVLADLGPLIRDVGGTVEAGKLDTVEGDESQLYQLFQNLIGNALKFHRPDAPPVVQVHSQTSADGGLCIITVRDNGIGFEMEQADRIFEVFQRLNSSRDYEGTGMGLAVVKKIVERHHGSIQVESRMGQGTAFTVSLPLRQG